jgi:transcriptional regulator with GAF, ATPase, and Fis domain
MTSERFISNLELDDAGSRNFGRRSGEVVVDACAQQRQCIGLGARSRRAARQVGTERLDHAAVVSDVDVELHGHPTEQWACHAYLVEIPSDSIVYSQHLLQNFNMSLRSADEQLHAASAEQLERRIMELALERTGAKHGAIFLWDPRRHGLVISFHMVEGMVVPMPTTLVEEQPNRPSGVAMHVFRTNRPYLAADTRTDPHYAPYFLDVGSIACVPIPWQKRPLGVLSVSARARHAFTDGDLAELEALAGSAAKFLRRAQLYWASRKEGRPFFIKGLSPEWLEVERRVEHVSFTDSPVLIHGESGTGKELVAHAVHFNSRRASGPFVTVNCAAIPETMLESLLFGHVRGAFTGATTDKIGEYQKADGGTLFLDELGELPMTLQPKLLRAVEYGEVQPLGSNRAPARVDVRLVCATNRDLPSLVKAGQFRDDLFYRLSVMMVELPPLRRYRNAIEVLAQVFREQSCERHKKDVPHISPSTLAALAAYEFPGNVRELKNAVEHAVILATGDTLLPEHLPRSIVVREAPPKKPARKSLATLRDEWLAPFEIRYLSDLLAETGGSVHRAAKHAGVDAVTLYRLLKKRGVAHGRRTG